MSKLYLVKFNADGTRESSLSAKRMSDKEIAEKQKEGYELVSLDIFNKLLGNTGGGEHIKDPVTGEIIPKPPHVPTLDEERAVKLQEIKEAYLIDVNAPVWFEQDMEQPDGSSFKKYVGYDADKDSQVDFHSSKERAKLLGSTHYNIYVNPNDFKEKEFTYHTLAMFERVLVAAGAYQEQVYVKYYALKAKTETAQTKEELMAIKW